VLFLKRQDVQKGDLMHPNNSAYEASIICVSQTDDRGDERKRL